jgi:NAD-dependent deacetylase
MYTNTETYPPELIAHLRSGKSVTVLTGAGISAESGIPTFREAQTGLWAQYHPEELATPQAFQRNPRLVWEWYTWRRQLVAKAHPNPGHLALVEMETFIPDFTLITQNVDGLHQRAGSGKSNNLIELHGNIQRTKCFDQGHILETWQDNELSHRCPQCGSMVRPDVVWFGESLSPGNLEAAWQAAGSCQIFFSIGTSAVVEPAASLPYLAKQRGALLVEINPQETQLSSSTDYRFKSSAAEALPGLVEAAWK